MQKRIRLSRGTPVLLVSTFGVAGTIELVGGVLIVVGVTTFDEAGGGPCSMAQMGVAA